MPKFTGGKSFNGIFEELSKDIDDMISAAASSKVKKTGKIIIDGEVRIDDSQIKETSKQVDDLRKKTKTPIKIKTET